ncbi:MAG: tRNA pseudouridine(13) synthase TruD, partial [Proteobacteria bacterium]|nr:tRNA pseudouridine(13) synthase TruD [Pseudomonadota bacterium]
LSAARAALFNALLAARVEQGSWSRFDAGDVAILQGSNSHFAAEPGDATLEQRLRALDVHPSGALWGRGELATQGAARQLEQRVAKEFGALARLLESQGLTQERRALRIAVLNLDDPLVAAMRRAGQPTLTYSLSSRRADFTLLDTVRGPALARRGEALLPVSRLKITGLHNAANALAALALGESAGLSRAGMLSALENFEGLPHRSQWVAEVHGVAYVNDSKGTNVGATLAAAQGSRTPLVLIAGGDGKQQDFAPLAQGLRGRVHDAVLIGRDAPAIEAALAGVCRTHRAASLPEAVRKASEVANPGDTVLLSPACASLDMFRDYAQRGEVFAQAVRALAQERA